MATDDERRRVAERLRMTTSNVRSAYGPSVLKALGLQSIGHESGEFYTLGSVDRLADLIEPSCDRDRLYVTYSRSTCGPDGRAYMVRVCHRTKGWERDFYAVDREALLALADAMETSADLLVKDDGYTFVKAEALLVYADRIREACGVVA